MFEYKTKPGWADMDFNAHMGNTAYLDKSVDTRMTFLAEHGFPFTEMRRIGIGPVVMKDDLQYFKEIGLMENIRVTLELAGLALDGSRWLMRNSFYRADNKLAAIVTSTGGWLNLSERRLVKAPTELLNALNLLTRSDDFVELPSSIKN